ncbi:unnamed protein product [Amoebophrya sp. A120]|nr:unnamed protein product [Amoebophrya sp. A120]|eukprot:GSA120T00022223001.1
MSSGDRKSKRDVLQKENTSDQQAAETQTCVVPPARMTAAGDEDQMNVSRHDSAKQVQVYPEDTLGLPVGDPVVYGTGFSLPDLKLSCQGRGTLNDISVGNMHPRLERSGTNGRRGPAFIKCGVEVEINLNNRAKSSDFRPSTTQTKAPGDNMLTGGDIFAGTSFGENYGSFRDEHRITKLPLKSQGRVAQVNVVGKQHDLGATTLFSSDDTRTAAFFQKKHSDKATADEGVEQDARRPDTVAVERNEDPPEGMTYRTRSITSSAGKILTSPERIRQSQSGSGSCTTSGFHQHQSPMIMATRFPLLHIPFPRLGTVGARPLGLNTNTLGYYGETTACKTGEGGSCSNSCRADDLVLAAKPSEVRLPAASIKLSSPVVSPQDKKEITWRQQERPADQEADHHLFARRQATRGAISFTSRKENRNSGIFSSQMIAGEIGGGRENNLFPSPGPAPAHRPENTNRSCTSRSRPATRVGVLVPSPSAKSRSSLVSATSSSPRIRTSTPSENAPAPSGCCSFMAITTGGGGRNALHAPPGVASTPPASPGSTKFTTPRSDNSTATPNQSKLLFTTPKDSSLTPGSGRDVVRGIVSFATPLTSTSPVVAARAATTGKASSAERNITARMKLLFMQPSSTTTTPGGAGGASSSTRSATVGVAPTSVKLHKPRLSRRGSVQDRPQQHERLRFQSQSRCRTRWTLRPPVNVDTTFTTIRGGAPAPGCTTRPLSSTRRPRPRLGSVLAGASVLFARSFTSVQAIQKSTTATENQKSFYDDDGEQKGSTAARRREAGKGSTGTTTTEQEDNEGNKRTTSSTAEGGALPGADSSRQAAAGEANRRGAGVGENLSSTKNADFLDPSAKEGPAAEGKHESLRDTDATPMAVATTVQGPTSPGGPVNKAVERVEQETNPGSRRTSLINQEEGGVGLAGSGEEAKQPITDADATETVSSNKNSHTDRTASSTKHRTDDGGSGSHSRERPLPTESSLEMKGKTGNPTDEQRSESESDAQRKSTLTKNDDAALKKSGTASTTSHAAEAAPATSAVGGSKSPSLVATSTGLGTGSSSSSSVVQERSSLSIQLAASESSDAATKGSSTLDSVSAPSSTSTTPNTGVSVVDTDSPTAASAHQSSSSTTPGPVAPAPQEKRKLLRREPGQRPAIKTSSSSAVQTGEAGAPSGGDEIEYQFRPSEHDLLPYLCPDQQGLAMYKLEGVVGNAEAPDSAQEQRERGKVIERISKNKKKTPTAGSQGGEIYRAGPRIADLGGGSSGSTSKSKLCIVLQNEKKNENDAGDEAADGQMGAAWLESVKSMRDTTRKGSDADSSSDSEESAENLSRFAGLFNNAEEKYFQLREEANKLWKGATTGQDRDKRGTKCRDPQIRKARLQVARLRVKGYFDDLDEPTRTEFLLRQKQMKNAEKNAANLDAGQLEGQGERTAEAVAPDRDDEDLDEGMWIDDPNPFANGVSPFEQASGCLRMNEKSLQEDFVGFAPGTETTQKTTAEKIQMEKQMEEERQEMRTAVNLALTPGADDPCFKNKIGENKIGFTVHKPALRGPSVFEAKVVGYNGRWVTASHLQNAFEYKSLEMIHCFFTRPAAMMQRATREQGKEEATPEWELELKKDRARELLAIQAEKRADKPLNAGKDVENSKQAPRRAAMAGADNYGDGSGSPPALEQGPPLVIGKLRPRNSSSQKSTGTNNDAAPAAAGAGWQQSDTLKVAGWKIFPGAHVSVRSHGLLAADHSYSALNNLGYQHQYARFIFRARKPASSEDTPVAVYASFAAGTGLECDVAELVTETPSESSSAQSTARPGSGEGLTLAAPYLARPAKLYEDLIPEVCGKVFSDAHYWEFVEELVASDEFSTMVASEFLEGNKFAHALKKREQYYRYSSPPYLFDPRGQIMLGKHAPYDIANSVVFGFGVEEAMSMLVAAYFGPFRTSTNYLLAAQWFPPRVLVNNCQSLAFFLYNFVSDNDCGKSLLPSCSGAGKQNNLWLFDTRTYLATKHAIESWHGSALNHLFGHSFDPKSLATKLLLPYRYCRDAGPVLAAHWLSNALSSASVQLSAATSAAGPSSSTFSSAGTISSSKPATGAEGTDRHLRTTPAVIGTTATAYGSVPVPAGAPHEEIINTAGANENFPEQENFVPDADENVETASADNSSAGSDDKKNGLRDVVQEQGQHKADFVGGEQLLQESGSSMQQQKQSAMKPQDYGQQETADLMNHADKQAASKTSSSSTPSKSEKDALDDEAALFEEINDEGKAAVAGGHKNTNLNQQENKNFYETTTMETGEATSSSKGALAAAAVENQGAAAASSTGEDWHQEHGTANYGRGVDHESVSADQGTKTNSRIPGTGEGEINAAGGDGGQPARAENSR